MSGYDKYRMEEALIKLGWCRASQVEVDSERGEEFHGVTPHYMMVPPDSLWKNRPKFFHVWEAEELQNILAPESLDL